MSTAMQRGQSNIDRTTRKLELALRDGRIYDAHQQLQTLWRRLTADNHVTEAVELACKVLPVLVAAPGEHGSAMDVVRTAINFFDDSAQNRIFMMRMFELMSPLLADPSADVKLGAFRESVKVFMHWSSKHGYPAGEPTVTHAIALLYMDNNLAYDAEAMLLRCPMSSSNALRVLGEAMVALMPDSETRNIIYLRWILVFLLADRVSYALLVLSWHRASGTQVGESSDGKVQFYCFDDQYLDLAQGLVALIAVPNTAGKVMDIGAFDELVTHYSEVIEKFEPISQMLNSLADMHFREKPVQKPNMLQELMKGFLN